METRARASQEYGSIAAEGGRATTDASVAGILSSRSSTRVDEPECGGGREEGDSMMVPSTLQRGFAGGARGTIYRIVNVQRLCM